MSKSRKKDHIIFLQKQKDFQSEFLPSSCWNSLKKQSFKCKAKRDIPCGICGEDSATAASFLRMFLITPISVIPPCPILTDLSPTLYSRLFLITPITVIPPCHILTHLSPTLCSRLFLITPISVIPPCPILTHLSPTLYSRLFLIAPITVIPPCHKLTYHQRYIADCF